MTLEQKILHCLSEAVQAIYQTKTDTDQFNLQETRKEFEGQITVVTFPITRFSKKSPELTGEDLGNYLKTNVDEIVAFNVIKGFLNLVISDEYWFQQLKEI